MKIFRKWGEVPIFEQFLPAKMIAARVAAEQDQLPQTPLGRGQEQQTPDVGSGTADAAGLQ